jgi:hypothetical protein
MITGTRTHGVKWRAILGGVHSDTEHSYAELLSNYVQQDGTPCGTKA